MTTAVELFTASGDFVTQVKLPLFVPPPEVILWGIRVFRLHAGKYVEAFAYAVPLVGAKGGPLHFPANSCKADDDCG